MKTKKNATKVASERVVNVTISESRQLKENVGKTVVTPNGTTFKVVSWQTASEHNENTEKTKKGSKMVIEQNGKQRIFYNNNSGTAAERLTNFYLECGLFTSGTSGTDRQKKFEVRNLQFATTEELQDLIKEAQKLLEEMQNKEEEKANLEWFKSLTKEEIAALRNKK